MFKRKDIRVNQTVIKPRPEGMGAINELGATLAKFGSDVVDFGLKEQARMDDLAVENAKNKYFAQRIQLSADYTKILGENAVNTDIVKDYQNHLQAVNDSIAATLKNKDQQEQWSRFYSRDKIKFGAETLSHKLTQSDKYAEDVARNTIQVATQVGHVNWQNEATVNESAGRIVASVTKEALRVGASKESLEASLVANLGPYWSGVISQNIANKHYDEAETLLKKHNEVLGLKNKILLNNLIKEKKESDTITIDIAKFFVTTPEPTNNDILKYFSTKYNGNKELQKAAVIEAKAIKTATDQEKVQQQNQAQQGIAGRMLEEMLTGDEIKLSGMSNTQKVTWINALNAKRIKGNKYISDTNIRAELKRRANTQPQNLIDDDIWGVVFKEKGITDTEAQAIQIRRDEELKKFDKPGNTSKRSSLSRAHKAIDSLKEFRTLDEEDETMNVLLWARLHEDLDDYIQANPDADAVEFVHTKVINPAKDERARSLLEFFWSGVLPGDRAINRNKEAKDLLRLYGKTINPKTIQATKDYLENK